MDIKANSLYQEMQSMNAGAGIRSKECFWQ